MDPNKKMQISYWKMGIFPIKHGDFPIKHGDFPIKNGDVIPAIYVIVYPRGVFRMLNLVTNLGRQCLATPQGSTGYAVWQPLAGWGGKGRWMILVVFLFGLFP